MLKLCRDLTNNNYDQFRKRINIAVGKLRVKDKYTLRERERERDEREKERDRVRVRMGEK